MNETVLSIDPGQSTGWSTWELGPELPMTRTAFGQIPKGVRPFALWFRGAAPLYDRIIFERFRLGGDVEYPDLTPVLIEGSLVTILSEADLPDPIWRYRQDKAPERCSDQILKAHGLWITAAMVDWSDGRDANDTQLHALAWAKENDHAPTLARYWPDVE